MVALIFLVRFANINSSNIFHSNESNARIISNNTVLSVVIVLAIAVKITLGEKFRSNAAL